MICSSRKEKLGSNTPINFITSSRFSPAEGPVATSEHCADSARSGSLSCRMSSGSKRCCKGYRAIEKGQHNKAQQRWISTRPHSHLLLWLPPLCAPPAALYESARKHSECLSWSPELRSGSLALPRCCSGLRKHKVKWYCKNLWGNATCAITAVDSTVVQFLTCHSKLSKGHPLQQRAEQLTGCIFEADK